MFVYLSFQWIVFVYVSFQGFYSSGFEEGFLPGENNFFHMFQVFFSFTKMIAFDGEPCWGSNFRRNDWLQPLQKSPKGVDLWKILLLVDYQKGFVVSFKKQQLQNFIIYSIIHGNHITIIYYRAITCLRYYMILPYSHGNPLLHIQTRLDTCRPCRWRSGKLRP